MRRRVVITGTGLVSPLGDSRHELHANLCGDRTGLKSIDGFDTPEIDDPLAGEVSTFSARDYLGPRNLRPLDRASELLTVAAKLALEDSGWAADHLADHDVGLVVGTMFSGVHSISEFDRRAMSEGPSKASVLGFANAVINAAAGQAAIWHNLRGINSTISTGASSGLQALEYACDMIRSGRAEAILAGGVETLCYETLLGFHNAGWLCTANDRKPPCPVPFDARRNGFCLAEGAGLLVLEDASSAMERNANILAEIKGCGSCFDSGATNHANGRPLPDAVQTTARSMRQALSASRLSPREVSCYSASANGCVVADRLEASAVALAFADQTDGLQITAIKSMIGESLGAAAAFQAIAAVQSLHDGRLPGIHGLKELESDFPLPKILRGRGDVELNNCLVNSLGFDGHCCSLVVGRWVPST